MRYRAVENIAPLPASASTRPTHEFEGDASVRGAKKLSGAYEFRAIKPWFV